MLVLCCGVEGTKYESSLMAVCDELSQLKPFQSQVEQKFRFKHPPFMLALVTTQKMFSFCRTQIRLAVDLCPPG